MIKAEQLPEQWLFLVNMATYNHLLEYLEVQQFDSREGQLLHQVDL